MPQTNGSNLILCWALLSIFNLISLNFVNDNYYFVLFFQKYEKYHKYMKIYIYTLYIHNNIVHTKHQIHTNISNAFKCYWLLSDNTSEILCTHNDRCIFIYLFHTSYFNLYHNGCVT